MQYVSLYQAGTGCPLTAPYTGATNRTLPEGTGSNVGTLSTNPFCNPNIDPSVMHMTANTPAAAPSPIVTNPGPGTTSVATGATDGGASAGAPGGATSNP